LELVQPPAGSQGSKVDREESGAFEEQNGRRPISRRGTPRRTSNGMSSRTSRAVTCLTAA
jgi:hypothetical protein